MPNYYYTDTNGSKQGLYTEQQLQRLIARGRITPTTPIETDTGFKGVASQVSGLNFTASSPFAKTVPPAPIQQGLPQSTPPVAPNPFTAAMPVAENPFTAPMPTTVSGQTVPPSTPVPITKKNKDSSKKVKYPFNPFPIFVAGAALLLLLVIGVSISKYNQWQREEDYRVNREIREQRHQSDMRVQNIERESQVRQARIRADGEIERLRQEHRSRIISNTYTMTSAELAGLERILDMELQQFKSRKDMEILQLKTRLGVP